MNDMSYARRVVRQNEVLVPMFCFLAGIPVGMLIAVFLMRT